ncbi:MAG TPA: redoxin domain-containing protein [Chloroflexi bacterium]|jgi:peroxiredoxin|nr:redoxin domain-containing protein [Chloroflexota bacterium]
MTQLRHDYDEFTARDAEVLAVGPDSAEAFSRFWQEHDIPFVGLADPEHRVADVYGQQVKLLRLGRMPALYIIDRRGHIRYRHRASSMSDIPPNREVLALLDALNREEKGEPEP